MAADYVTSLKSVLETFKGEVTGALDSSAQRLRQELRALQGSLERHFDSHFTAVEKNLSVPFSRTLPWDWVPDPDQYYDLDVFLDTRQLRYRGDPSYIVTATQYYLKYCAPNTDILKELGAAGGFYVPTTTTKLFAKMGKEVVERNKRLLHVTQVQKSGIPDDQVEFAWNKEAVKGLDDLLLFIPGGAPVTHCEKEFYLDIAKTVRGELQYKPIKELTVEELQLRELIQTQMSIFAEQLNSIAPQQSPTLGLQAQLWGSWELDVSSLLNEHEEAQRKLDEMQAESEPAERSLRIEEEAVRRALDSQRTEA